MVTCVKMKDRELEDKPFPLLELPAELWSRICRLAVEYEEAVMVCASSPSTFTKALLEPAITRVCRAIRAETLPIFSTRTIVFVGCCGLRLDKWLLKVPLAERHRLANVMIQGSARRLRELYSEQLADANYELLGLDEGDGKGVRRFRLARKADKHELQT